MFIYCYFFIVSASWSFCFTACIRPAAISSFPEEVHFLNNSLLGLDGLNYQSGVQEIRHLISVKK